MRVAKFKIPVSVFPEFLKYTQPLGLKSTVISTKEEMYEIEIPFTKEQNSLIDELEQLIEVFLLVSVIGIVALYALIEEAKKQSKEKTIAKVKKETATSSGIKNTCYFKDLLVQIRKEEAEKTKS